MGSNWYEAHNLAEQQKDAKKDFTSGKIDNRNDFHSYSLLLRGDPNSNIGSHNATGDAASVVSKMVGYFWKKYGTNKRDNLTIADLGGGAGFIASKIQEEFQSQNVYSFDIAEDASEFGKISFPKVHFVNGAIEETSKLEGKPFDIILANEFYPFTRNKDWEYQRGYVQMCINNTRPDGIVLFGLTQNDNSLFNNIEKLKEEFSRYCIKLFFKPYASVLRLCGGRIKLASILSQIAGINNQRHWFIVIKK